MQTPFGSILKSATDQMSDAVGGAFAAGDGELVDSWSHLEDDQWAFLTAHMGIVINHVRSAMHTFHFGDVEWVFINFHGLDILAEQLGDKYFVLLACKPAMDLEAATETMRVTAQRIREEMF